MDSTTLSGAYTYLDGDVLYRSGTAGSKWTAISTGDLDNDGLDDLAFTHSNGSVAIHTSPSLSGTVDVGGAADAQITGCCDSLAYVDITGDGTADLVGVHDNAYVLTWPFSGTRDIASAAVVTMSGSGYSTLRIPRSGWDGTLITSGADVGSSGGLASPAYTYGDTVVLDQARLIATGEQVGSEFGADVQTIHADADFSLDLAVSAPGFDGVGASAGAVYVLLGPPP